MRYRDHGPQNGSPTRSLAVSLATAQEEGQEVTTTTTMMTIWMMIKNITEGLEGIAVPSQKQVAVDFAFKVSR